MQWRKLLTALSPLHIKTKFQRISCISRDIILLLALNTPLTPQQHFLFPLNEHNSVPNWKQTPCRSPLRPPEARMHKCTNETAQRSVLLAVMNLHIPFFPTRPVGCRLTTHGPPATDADRSSRLSYSPLFPAPKGQHSEEALQTRG